MNAEPDPPARRRPLFTIERHGRRAELDRSFDVEYWQRLGHEAIFSAAWQLVEETFSSEGDDGGEPRLQRAVEALGRLPG